MRRPRRNPGPLPRLTKVAETRAEKSTEAPLISHLLELRNRLLWAIAGVAVLFIPLAFFAQDIYSLLAGPLMAQMPEGTTMIATEVAAPFLTPFKMAFLLAVVLAMPWLLYQVWAFVAPGLYNNERRLAAPLIISSTLLFYAGMAFAYFIVFPLIFAFLVAVAPEGVSVMTDISRYLDFVIKLFLAFGAAFEMPVAIVLMVWTGFTTPGKLKQKRPYILVGAFVIGMLLTPPDVVSQTLLALPAYVLFEIGIIAAQLLVPGSKQVDEQREGKIPSE